MSRIHLGLCALGALLLAAAMPAGAQDFRVQCPTTTLTHPSVTLDSSGKPTFPEPAYTGAKGAVNGTIKCQQVSGGDGYATMADGTQTYLFAFGPLSGLADIAKGLPGTMTPDVFNTMYGINNKFPYDPTGAVLMPGEPATTLDAGKSFTYNGAIGLSPSQSQLFTIYDISEGTYPACTVVSGIPPTAPPAPPAINGATATTVGATTVTVVLNAASPFNVGDTVVIAGTGVPAYDGPHVVQAAGVFNYCFTQTAYNPTSVFNGSQYAFQFVATSAGGGDVNSVATATASAPIGIDRGHVDPRQIMDVGVMNGSQPAPQMAIDEDDEFFLTLTNVGMIMRPDLFEQHTIHFHGYPNASSFYDGVPDASVAINIAASFTYYYLAPDAGTYFFHCHITPPEHLQMGMVGQLYVRPRQNRWTGDLYAGLQAQQNDLRTACNSSADLACSNPLPAINTAASNDGTHKYVYNDGDGSTAYDVEYPVQMMGFDPNFHFVGMTFNPEGFADMKDKYFMLNGRGYPDTVTPGPMETPSSDGVKHFSQPQPAIINIPVGGRALLRLSDLSVAEYMTLQSLGIPMTVVGWNAKLLRDQAGNNMAYKTNSITMGGGESSDIILDASDTTKYAAGQTYYLYSANLDQLSNDAENFGGAMTEVHICKSVSGPTFGNTCN